MDIKGLKIHFTDNQKLKITEDLKDILDTGQLAAGKYVKLFEDNWSKINNCKFGIAVSSGGAAFRGFI
jgi:Predicted pyridoxal phosphate-dependent enzyme apparently involved in regulation of cell wall biogenesis